jgi:hypothetical protein
VCHTYTTLNVIAARRIVTVSNAFSVAKMYRVNQMFTDYSIGMVTELIRRSHISMESLISSVTPIVTVGLVNTVMICRQLALIYLQCAIYSQR